MSVPAGVISNVNSYISTHGKDLLETFAKKRRDWIKAALLEATEPAKTIAIYGFAEPDKWTKVLDIPVYMERCLVIRPLLVHGAATWESYNPVEPVLWPSYAPLAFWIRVELDGRKVAEYKTAPTRSWDRDGIVYFNCRGPLRVCNHGWHKLTVYVRTVGDKCMACNGHGGSCDDMWDSVAYRGLYGFYLAVDDYEPRARIAGKLATCLGRSEQLTLATLEGPGKWTVTLNKEKLEIESGSTTDIALDNSSLPLSSVAYDLEILYNGQIPLPATVVPVIIDKLRDGNWWILIPDTMGTSFEIVENVENMKGMKFKTPSWKGRSVVDVYWPKPSLDMSVSSTWGLPGDKVTVTYRVTNVGTCSGVFDINGARMELAPGSLVERSYEVALGVDPVEVSSYVAVRLVNGMVFREEKRETIRPAYYVLARNGRIVAHGGPEAVTMRITMAGLVEPKSDSTEAVEGVPVPVYSTDVKLRPWEEQEVAGYRLLLYMRVESSRPAAMMVEGRLYRGESLEYVSPLAAPLLPLLRARLQ